MVKKKIENTSDAISILVGVALMKSVSGIAIYLLMRRAIRKAAEANKQS